MRKEVESERSDNTRGITRMSDDQRLGSIMIIILLKTTMEMNVVKIYKGGSRKRANQIAWETIDFDTVKSVNEVSEKLGVNHTTVQAYCKRNGIDLPYLGMTNSEKGRITCDWQAVHEWFIKNGSSKYMNLFDTTGSNFDKLKVLRQKAAEKNSWFVWRVKNDLIESGFKKVTSKLLLQAINRWIDSEESFLNACTAADYYGDSPFDHM